MYQDQNGNVSIEEHYYQQWPVRFQPNCLYSIQEETYIGECGYLTSEVPDVEVDLQCDEVIEDWDDTGNYTALKGGAKLPLAASTFPYVPDCRPHVYDDYAPPNSPVSGPPQEKPLFYLQNRYVNSLLQIWRDSLNPNEASERNPVSDVSDSEDSDGISMPTDSSNPCSQTSEESLEMEGLGSTDQNNNSQDVEDFNELALSGNGTSFNSDGETDLMVPSQSNIRQLTTENENITELDRELARAMFPYNRNSGSFSPRVMSPYNLLRSVSPRILRSPSPISSRSSSPRFFQSPGLDEIQANLSDLPLEDINALVLSGEQYYRTRSPQFTSDQLVPDVEMEFYEAASDSDEFPANYRRQRVANSCQVQVVPDYIEE